MGFGRSLIGRKVQTSLVDSRGIWGKLESNACVGDLAHCKRRDASMCYRREHHGKWEQLEHVMDSPTHDVTPNHPSSTLARARPPLSPPFLPSRHPTAWSERSQSCNARPTDCRPPDCPTLIHICAIGPEIGLASSRVVQFEASASNICFYFLLRKTGGGFFSPTVNSVNPALSTTRSPRWLVRSFTSLEV